MKFDAVIADPAGNITLLVLSEMTDRKERAALVDAALASRGGAARGQGLWRQIEQVGFVLPPHAPGRRDNAAELWRLDMMGGEFCGNAGRSFGLWVAACQQGLHGQGGQNLVEISISGMDDPLRVHVDTEATLAAAEIKPPLPGSYLPFRHDRLPVYTLEGINHIIAEGYEPGEGIFNEIRGAFEAACTKENIPQREALGVLFWDPLEKMMRPAVYVYGSGSLVFESSCGSGSAALGFHLGESLADCRTSFAVSQPGGLIEVSLEKEAGAVKRLAIGGPVFLSKTLSFEFEY